jgi:hypothetical protein
VTLSAEGSRNALLALHLGEGDPRALAGTRAHVAACAECRDYLALLAGVQEALGQWEDEAPPADLRERVLARATRSPRPAPAFRPAMDAMPLLGVLPVMAAMAAAVRALAARLPVLPAWSFLEGSPALQAFLPVGAATVVLLALGALGTLALAPALVLESGGGPRWHARALRLRG